MMKRISILCLMLLLIQFSNAIAQNWTSTQIEKANTSKDIVLQLLIDHDVPSLGHRINCLNKDYSKIGVSVQNHLKWDTCAVIDMIW